jgi:methyl-accepting chemotaxis protein
MTAPSEATPEELTSQAFAEALAKFLRENKHHPADSVVTNRSRLGKTYDTATNLLGRSGRHLVSGTTAIAMSYMSDYFANTALDNVISFLVGMTISVAYSKLTSILATKQQIGRKAARIRNAMDELSRQFSDFTPPGSQSPQQIINRLISNGMETARHHVENEVDRTIGVVAETASNLRQGIDSAGKTAQEIGQTTTGAIHDVSVQFDQIASALKNVGFTAKEIADALMEMNHAAPLTADHPEPGPYFVVIEKEPVSATKGFRKLSVDSYA